MHRVRGTDTNRYMNAILQDTYDVNDDDDAGDAGGDHSDVAIDFFDAPTMFGERLVAPDDANADPTDKLIHAIQALRDVIVDNTNAQRNVRSRRSGGGAITGGGGGTGMGGCSSGIPYGDGGLAGPHARVPHSKGSHKTNNIFKDDRLKIRSSKVSDSMNN